MPVTTHLDLTTKTLTGLQPNLLTCSMETLAGSRNHARADRSDPRQRGQSTTEVTPGNRATLFVNVNVGFGAELIEPWD